MVFTSLEQRMAQTYLDVFPNFIPDNNAEIGIVEQEKFYQLIKNLYQLAVNEPLLFVSSLHEDDVFPKMYKKPYGKPELLKDMRKFLKAMDSLLQNMFLMGKNSNVKIGKKQQKILSRIGISDYDKLPLAWSWMANRPESNNIEFMYCLFDRNYPYTSDIYANLMGEAIFRKLENWMIAQGYIKYDIYEGKDSDCKLSLMYVNPLWDKNPPRGGNHFKVKHTGISVVYEPTIQYPTILGLCIPNGLKVFLNNFQLMEEKTKSYVVTRTQKCSGCRYCVQTDKTKSRPLACIKVNFEQEDYNLCPYYPGFMYSWSKSISIELIEQVIDLLTFMDKFAPNKNIKE
jgi:hypothetical protein